MPTAFIQARHAEVSLVSEHLLVTYTDERDLVCKRELPLYDLDRLILCESVSVSSAALSQILRRAIPVSIVSHRNRFLGSFLPATQEHGASRLSQYQCTLDANFALTVSKKIIAAKIYNQRRFIQRVATFRRIENQPVSEEIPTILIALERTVSAIEQDNTISSLDSLRGHEGIASARYFAAWGSLLPEAFPFERRSTRPPLNPVNAVLSFASTLIYGEMHTALHTQGLDPALGVLHTTENGRWSLALDLMEPFRPVLAEALTLDLFSRRMLNEEHFEPQNGGIYLTKEGRSKLIMQYEKRMERQFMSEFVGHRTTLRQQLENQATLFKSCLEHIEKFQPFRMN